LKIRYAGVGAVKKQENRHQLQVKKLKAKLLDCQRASAASLVQAKEREAAAIRLARLLFLQQERERKEISRELHDEVAQVLIGINFALEVLIKEAANRTKDMKSRIQETQVLLQSSMESIHHFAREMRPMILDDLGLLPAVKSYVSSFSEMSSIKVEFTHSGVFRTLSDIRKVVIFRIIQESLTNVAKHAKATKAWVKIARVRDLVRVEIRDNGCGFRVKRPKRSGSKDRLGIVGMTERVRLAGGTFFIESQIGSGTKVRVEIPTWQDL
jgi:signal transduction histidine kinase